MKAGDIVEIILIGLIIVFIISYRTKKGESVYKFISQQAISTYKKMNIPYFLVLALSYILMII